MLIERMHKIITTTKVLSSVCAFSARSAEKAQTKGDRVALPREQAMRFHFE
jgi:hypothetical protein